MLIFKSILCQTGVTKGLELALEIIKLAEQKWPQLLASFQELDLPLLEKVTKMSRQSHVYYNVAKLLICYLINKIEIDYSISQVRTKKQLYQENYILAVQMMKWLTNTNLNPFGSNFDPLMAVINKKFVEEAVQTSFKYRQTELAHLSDEALLNASLSTITNRHDKIELQSDLVKDSIMTKANLVGFTK